MAQQAQDTFVAVLGDGTERLVTRGEMLPDSHELVKRDAQGGGALFRPVNIDGGDLPAPKSEAPPPDPPVTARAAVKPPLAGRGKAS